MNQIKFTSDNGIQFLIKEEGLVKRPYLDQAGIPTIGVGMTFYPDTGNTVKMTDPPLTTQRAIDLYRIMLKGFEYAIYTKTRDDINQNQFDALVSFTYNIGTGGFKGSTLLKKVNINPEDPEIRTQFEAWRNATVDGVKKPILLARRKREANLYFSPVPGIKKSADETYIDQIKHIQTQLGFTGKGVDGIFGKNTLAAVKAFQKAHGLVSDGIVGPLTLAELNKI